VVLFVVAAVLLISAGGAGVVAAPVTLPLMLLVVARHPSGAVIGGLTAAALAWGLLYLIGGEVAVLIWLVPLTAGAAAVAAMATIGHG
jgi:hypothetical protein